MVLIDRRSDVRHSLSAHGDAPVGLSFSGDERWLISGAVDKSVRVWDVATGLLVDAHHFENSIIAARVNTQGTRVAAGGWDRLVSLFDMPPATTTIEPLASLLSRLTATEANPEGPVATPRCEAR
jgi:WD40 repeat protein